MRRLTAFLLGMVVLTTCVASPGTAPATAMTHFQHDLVSVLALRVGADPLLGAALLARTLPDASGPLSYHALLTRAAQAPGAGPATTWAQLVDCNPAAMDCPNAHALATLKHQAPENAAVWLLALGQAAHDGDAAATRAALAKAAAASTYDDYDGVQLKALATVVTALPPPADLYTGKAAVANSAAGVRALLVFGLGNLHPIPGFQAAAEICASDETGAATRAACLHLANTLSWAGAPLARSLGLHLQQTLAPDADQREQAAAAWRDLAWQIHNFGRLTLAARDDAQQAGNLLALAHQGGTRMSLILAALRAAGIPVHAPVTWQPARTAPAASASTGRRH